MILTCFILVFQIPSGWVFGPPKCPPDKTFRDLQGFQTPHKLFGGFWETRDHWIWLQLKMFNFPLSLRPKLWKGDRLDRDRLGWTMWDFTGILMMRYHQWDGWRLLCTIACCVFHCFPHGWFFEWHLTFYYGTLTIWLEYICKSHWFHPELPWVYFYSFQIICLSEPPSFQGSLITCSTCISACADGALWQMAIDLLQEVEVCNPWRRMTDGGAMGEPLGVFSAWGLWTKHEQNYFSEVF